MNPAGTSTSVSPIENLPPKVLDKIWSFLTLNDLNQVRLVSKFWKDSSTSRFLALSFIRLTPTLTPSILSTYLSDYSPGYLHQNFIIDTTFLQAQSLEEYINISMSMEFISLLFDEYGSNIKCLVFRHRDCIQMPGQSNNLTKGAVLQFLYRILRNCPLLEELELDVDVLRSDWFPEDVIFCELKSLRLDSLRSTAEVDDGSEVLTLAQRIVDTIPNLRTFVTRELWSKLQAKLLSNMASNYLENYSCWPNLTGIKILEGIRFESRLLFGEKMMGLGVGGLDTGLTSRPLTVLHLGVVHIKHIPTAFRIMDTFRLSLVEVQMSVEIKNGLIPNTINHMPYLKKLSFVDCTIDVSKITLSSDDEVVDSDYEPEPNTNKRKGSKKKMRLSQTNQRKKTSPSKRSSQSTARRIYRKEMFDFCCLSTMFQTKFDLQQILPELHTLELTFTTGFRRPFYKFFFPGLLNYPHIQEYEIFPQIQNLKLNYHCLQLDDTYLGWTQAVAKLFPNAHNKHLNYARSRPEVGVPLDGCYSDSD